MIEIVIKRKTREIYKVRENVIAEKIPSQYTEDAGYSDQRKRVVLHEKYAVQEVEKVDEKEEILLRQDIADGNGFDLRAVIKAINQIDAK